MRLNREAVKSAAPFLVPFVRGWHRVLTTWRSRPSYVARHAPFLEPGVFDQVFFDGRGNHPTQHIRITRRFAEIGGAKVLALGCREGSEGLLWLRNGAHSVTGLDYVPRTVAWRQLRERGVSVHFVAGDARRLPFADDAFDLVSSESLLEHVRHPGDAVAEAHRVVKPGGLVYSIFGPLYYTAGGAHYFGDFEHLLLDHESFVELIKKRNDPIERQECLTYLEHDMFSYWTAGQYLSEFRKQQILHMAVLLSPDAARFRRTHSTDWARLTTKHHERDLLISGLAIWSRKRTS